MDTTWDGLPISREPPFGATVAVWRKGREEPEWLVLHRAHHGPGYDGDWAWTPPSGARFPGEAVEVCARRELREETGLELECVPVGPAGEWALYVAEAPPDAQVEVDAEHDRFAWLSLEAALACCRPAQVRSGLEAAAAARTVPKP